MVICLLILKDAMSHVKSSLWGAGGTGARIFGDSVASKAVAGRGRGGSTAAGAKSAQEKLADMQQKLQNKNLSNKKRKELKKQERKMRGDEKKRSPRPETNGTNDDSDLVVANVQALTI